MNKTNSQLESSIFFNKYSKDITEEYEIDDSTTPWLFDLLTELEEENPLNDEGKKEFPKGSLSLKAEIARKTNLLLKDHLIVRAKLKAQFHQPCGRCLFPLPEELDLELSAAFLHESQEELPEYADVTTVFADGAEMELYFIKKGMADIAEFIHEQVYIEITPFPRCEGECVNPVLF